MGIIDYVKETKGELKHVNWPTKSQALNYTILVIVLSVVTALLLALFDLLFTGGLKILIGRGL
jgi:preprotein translocase subunit SecE